MRVLYAEEGPDEEGTRPRRACPTGRVPDEKGPDEK
jgi:hypothetical protein